MAVTGFLHPGSMGASLAQACSGRTVWASAGRSEATSLRAAAAGMHDAVALEQLAETCDTIVSICPPGAALDVADAVAATGYSGVYVDANAVSPATCRLIADRFVRFVDGSVIGPPVREPGRTRLYLSGTGAEGVAALWEGSDLDARVITGGAAGSASALKMAYAGWTKGTSALLMAIRGLAEAEGVAEALLAEWRISQPDLVDRSRRSARGSAPKAWRWADEMREIAAGFESTGLPSGFHEAAAEIFDRLGRFKDDDPPPSLEEVIVALLANDPTDR